MGHDHVRVHFRCGISLCLTFQIGICSFLGGNQILPSCCSMRRLQIVEMYFDSMMYDGLYFSHGVWFGNAYTGAYPTHQWLILKAFILFKAYPFLDDEFILGHSHHMDLFCDIEIWSFVYDCILMDYRDDDTLGSVFSAYLVRLGYPLAYIAYPYSPSLIPLHLHPSFQSLTCFPLSLPISSLHMTLSHPLD